MDKHNEVKKYDNIVSSYLDKLYNNLNSSETEKLFKDYLDFNSKFYSYSTYNTILLYSQAMARNENISNVGSFTFWANVSNEKGENVRITKGVSSYKILAPVLLNKYEKDEEGEFIYKKGEKIPILDENGKKVKYLAGFKDVSVFDVSQTNAIEIGAYKELGYRTKEQKYDTKLYADLKETISNLFDVKIYEVNQISGGGYYIPENAEIAVNVNKSIDNKISTLFHELGHHILHRDKILNGELKYSKIHEHRGLAEGQAESFSYAISSMFGINNKSEFYLKSWGNTPEDFKKNIEIIHDNIKLVASKIHSIIERQQEYVISNLSLSDLIDKFNVNISTAKDTIELNNHQDISFYTQEAIRRSEQIKEEIKTNYSTHPNFTSISEKLDNLEKMLKDYSSEVLLNRENISISM